MFKRLIATSLLLLAPLAIAQDNQWVEGEHYDVISPALRTSETDKIEVVELVWLWPLLYLVTRWKQDLPDDVVFKGSPAVWNKPMELHAAMYYTADALGVKDELHGVLFQAMNVDGKRLGSEKEIRELFVANGVSAEDFDKAFNSFGVKSQVRQANSRARAAKITGTPEIMVNGKYRISTRKAGSQANMLKIADFLIEKERDALATRNAD